MRGIPPSLGWFAKRGEVYLVQLDKPRPAIILSVDQLIRSNLFLESDSASTHLITRKNFDLQ